MARKRKTPDSYARFLAAKDAEIASAGIESASAFPKAMKPFQADLTRWALKRGRAAVFAGTGLGKSIIQLAWSDAVCRHTDGGRVLILTPLAVAQQTVNEATKFGIDGVAYALDQNDAKTRIVITNYDRFDKFDPGEFSGIVLDESSIIKAADGKTRKMLTESCKVIPYRLCCSATPAPNDWVELGTHAEFLGVMTEKQMLAMYFVHDGSIRAGETASGDGWRLKRHAENAFWKWVASWGAVVRHPRDLGYEEPGYDLPPLIRHQITVDADHSTAGDKLFLVEARTLSERLTARRISVDARVAAGAAIVNANLDRPWLVWCNLNSESEMLTKAITDAVEIKGANARDDKVNRLIGFSKGDIRVLVSKPSIAGHGMNFQVCSDMVFIGLSDSFEELYQAIRRCWRFGQTKPVNVYLVASELEGAVVANLQRKEDQYEAMGDAMAVHMKDLVRKEVRGKVEIMSRSKSTVRMEVPQWISM